MAFDLDGLVKELGLEGDDEKAVRTALGKPERLSVLEKNQLRQSDYSKQMNALKTEQAKLASAEERLNAETAEWARLTSDEQSKATTLRDSLEKAETKVLQLTQRVTRIATDAGLDPSKALEGVDQAPPKKEPDVPAVDLSKYVPTEQFAAMQQYQFNLSLQLPRILAEHKALTGEDLDPRVLGAEIIERSSKKGANTDPVAIWEEKYGIQAKRESKQAEARSAEIEAARKKGYDEARSEAALPVPPSHGLRSPVMRTPDGNQRTSVLQRPAPETGVRSAASALASGKYREQQPTGAAR